MQKRPVEFSKHSLLQMKERGASQEEVFRAIEQGEEFPVKKGRKGYRLNLAFNKKWGAKKYKTKQMIPIVAEEKDKLIIVTVYVFYF